MTRPSSACAAASSAAANNQLAEARHDVARNIDRFVRGEPLENVVTTT
jgi:hypothetical protein